MDDLGQRAPSFEAPNFPNPVTPIGQVGMAAVSELLGRTQGPFRR